MDHVSQLRELRSHLAAGRQDYDFQPPSFVSHARDYASDRARLRKYSQQVVNGRIMILFAFSRMNTQALIDTFLLGVDARNPFPLLMSARSQLELLSVVADTTRVVAENAGEHADNLVERISAVDEALINATFGTRSPLLKEWFPKMELSRLREPTEQDLAVLSSKNVITRLDRLTKSGKYPSCKTDYERLCEYVHPNFGMNMLRVVPSPINPKFLRFSLTDQDPFSRALTASAQAMLEAAKATLSEMEQVQPPFGMGEVTYLGGRH